MKTLKNKLIKFTTVLLVILTVLSAGVSAAVPYESYTHWSDVGAERKDVYNRPMYEPLKALDADSIGVEPFNEIKNIFTDNKGFVYILDSKSRIIVLDEGLKLVREIGIIGNESYDEAESVYVHTDNSIYICDTLSKRILHISNQGSLIEIIGQPESVLIPDDFDFRPLRTVIDSQGYMYVLSDGSYYGALLYSPEKKFLGFYGANAVTNGISGVLTNIKNRIFPNNDKKGNTARNLPYCFNDITIDNRDFIYTSNGYTDEFDREGQIRRLGPGTGNNILNSDDINFVDTNVNAVYNNGAMEKQDIMDIEVDSDGFLYALESAYGRIYLYDGQCRLLTAFGGGMGDGKTLGTFTKVTGMSLLKNGEHVLVTDGITNRVTVFSLTSFGKKAKELISLTINGKYDKIGNGWKELLKQDNNFQPAYSGLARLSLNNGNYKDAMKYAKIGYDRETYAVAFEYVRKDFLDKNFAWIFVSAFALLVVIGAFLIISSRKNVTLIKNKKISQMFSVMIHPSNVFTDIKEKGQGSVLLCGITLAIYYIVTVLQTLAGGFLFSVYDAESFNSLWVLVRSVGLVVLWIAANWLVCTLLGGKGKLKEIIIVTCYSLWPIIIEKLIRLILTNVLIPAEASFLGILDTLAIIYFVILMVIGLLKIHDFSMTRLVATSTVSVIGVAAIIFLGIMIIMLLQQFFAFVATFVAEIMTI